MMWGVILFLLLGCALVVFLLSRRKARSLKGKHVMITGGSSGIGKCLAAEAIRRGAAVITLVARNNVRLNAAKKELEELIVTGTNQKVHVVAADVSQVSVMEEIAKSEKEVGSVDILVNCAGITHTATMLDTPPEKYEELLKVNILGSIHPTKAVLPSMISKKSGTIVFISSQAGQLGLYGYTAYSTTKYGLRGLAETLQMELKPYNIHVSISFPPDTDTPQLQAEVPQRDTIQSNLASFGTVFQPTTIARDIWTGVERGAFQITHGMDGVILGTLTAGFSPAHRVWDAVLQVLLMGVFRAVGLCYRVFFNRVVAGGLAKIGKNK